MNVLDTGQLINRMVKKVINMLHDPPNRQFDNWKGRTLLLDGQINDHMIQKLTNTSERVLAYFFQHPSTEVHIRGLADRIDIPYSSVRNALQELERQTLVEKREESKMTFYTAARDKEPFRRRKRLYNLEVLSDCGVISALEERFRPDAIVLFGSYLQGRDRVDSDIDIAIVNGRQVAIDLSEYETALERSFQFVHVGDPCEETVEFRNTLANGYVLRGHLVVV